jgi:hypothetical protein
MRLALSSPVCHHEYRRSRTRFDSDLIIHRRSNSLLATQVAFRRLNGNMSQKELDLFQLSSCSVAQASTGPTKIMRSQLLQSNPLCRILHDVPDGFLCHAFTQDPPHLRHSTEDLTSVDTRSIQPDSQLFHYLTGDRNRANVSCLALQIDNGPVFLSLFKVFDSEANGFVAPQAAGKQQRKKRTISLALELFAVRGSPERDALFNSQPVAQANAQIPHPLDAANPSGEIGTQQPGVGCLVGEAPNGAQVQIDGSRGKQAGLKVAAIAENHRSVQSQSRFRALPIDEPIDCVAVSALAVDTRQAVQYSRL